MPDGKKIGELAGHRDSINSVCFSPDGKLLASGGWDKTVRVWELGTWRELLRLDGHLGGVNAVCFSSDGKKLASGGEDTTVLVWQMPSG